MVLFKAVELGTRQNKPVVAIGRKDHVLPTEKVALESTRILKQPKPRRREAKVKPKGIYNQRAGRNDEVYPRSFVLFYVSSFFFCGSPT